MGNAALQPEPLDLVDSHAHVDMPEFEADREAMLARAQAAGVRMILAIGGAPGAPGAPGALDSALPFAERHDWIYAAAGIHPQEAGLASPEHYDTLSKLAQHPRFLAWGEIGLDYHFSRQAPAGPSAPYREPRPGLAGSAGADNDEPERQLPQEVQEKVQQRVFADQLALARAARRPVVIHCRDAWPDCLALLEEHWRSSGLGGIFHCFSGTLEEARQGIEMGFLISFAGNVTYPKAQNLRDVAAALPGESILIETDSPFLAPQQHRGRRNEPAFVAEVARSVATVRNLAPPEFARAASENFRRLFRIEVPGTGSGELTMDRAS